MAIDRRFAAHADHVPCALLTLDADGIIVGVNRYFCDLLGYAVDDVVGTKIIRYLSMGGRVFSQTHWFPLMQMQGSVSELKLDFRAASGERIPTLLNAFRHEQDGAIFDEVAMFVVPDRHRYEQTLRESRQRAEDALEASRAANAAQLQAEAKLRAANELLLAADKFKDAFLATLAHELRNPLSSIRNITSVLAHLSKDHPKLAKPSEILGRQVTQMKWLVDDLLDAARIGQGKVALRLTRLDLNVLLAQELDEAMPAINVARHAVDIDVDSAPLIVDGDPIRLSQIIQNLLNNAIKYTPEGGRIRLRAFREQDYAVLQVVDNGIGIPHEQQTHIFEMFGQLSAGHELAQGGLGIGLALIHGLVGLHGGTIVVKSDGAGQGSAFEVRLPLAREQGAGF